MAKIQNQTEYPSNRDILTDPFHLVAFGFGSGLSPVAPGTCGTLVAVPLYAALAGLGLPVYGGVVLLLLLAGIYATGRSSERLGVSDPSGIVFDEIVGFLITMAGVPFSWPAAIVGFALFRLFDVWKPWPIRKLDRSIHGGLGIMLDDALAGVFAAVCLHGFLPYAESILAPT